MCIFINHIQSCEEIIFITTITMVWNDMTLCVSVTEKVFVKNSNQHFVSGFVSGFGRDGGQCEESWGSFES